jgi:hypothetical protein
MKHAAGMATVLWLAVASAAPLESQQREIDAGWWDWAAPLVVGGQEIPTRRGVVIVPESRRDRRAEKAGGRGSVGHGPPFCRNGAGHPVHGWQWCVRKGHAGPRTVYEPRWERRRWEDVIFRTPRDRRRNAALDEVTLADVLGSVVLGRFQQQRPHDGGAPLTGRWVAGTNGARVLQLRAGHKPIAELSDLSGDGRVDLVLVYRGS